MSFYQKLLDASKYQTNIDYEATKQDIDGVILRIGLTYWGALNKGKDELFDKHYQGFKSVGLPVGAYYYSCADTVEEAKREAEYCLTLLRGLQFELPIFYDVENNERQGKLTKEELTEITKTFCDILEQNGYYVGYYSYTSWLLTKFDTTTLSKYYTLWKADYRTNYDKTIPCGIHQYTSQGRINGYSDRVDLNHCYINYTDLILSNNLNNFKGDTPSITTFIPCQLKIGYCSNGDIKTIGNQLNGLNVDFSLIQDGYITTELIMEENLLNEITEFIISIGNIKIEKIEGLNKMTLFFNDSDINKKEILIKLLDLIDINYL